MGILFVSLAPVFIILFYIYFRDKYEKEPVGLLIKAVILGMLTVIPIAIVERLLLWIMPDLGHAGGAAYQAFLVAGATEEIGKYLALFLLIWRSPEFNEQFDGIVYAVFISLGFAAVENVIYVLEGGYRIAIIRALTAVPVHALFGITMGYYFGIARRHPELKRSYLSYALVIPIFLHGLYDFVLMVEINWLLLLFIPYVIMLYITGMRKMRRLSDASVYRPDDQGQLLN